ncbi:MAG: GNAT family N-acetyltransferase [Deltaproteobacteria bacterium]|nr:GNAT family N-acetyltransferase [Deltaproteobacteria bacterium]
MTLSKPHFDGHYQEEATLADGSRVHLRFVRPEDKARLQAAFEKLSPESRYLRFFSHKQTLTDAELEVLTNVDGDHHVAIGAALDGPGGELVPLGVARFVRLADEPAVAEAAIVVVDRFHGRGLGTLLLQRLAAAALERGITTFRCEFFVHNHKVRRLLENMAPSLKLEVDGDVMKVEIPVPSIDRGQPPTRIDRDTPLFHLLGQSAQGAIELRLRRLLLKIKE